MTVLDTPLLALEELTVQRGEIPLCEGVTLQLSAGSICHLIGANGTGKTTLLMQLAGLLPVSSGEVTYQGQSSLPVQPLYVSHQLGIHPNLTVAQNLTFLLNLYGITPSAADIDDALTWVGLQGFETISSSHLSAGQTRRITLARLYLLTPDVTPL
ncbi:ABC transporter ATP-binding protein, partial [Marinobacter sp. 1Y8]